MGENGWAPMTATDMVRREQMPTEVFHIGANRRPAKTEKAALKSLEAARALSSADVVDYLRSILDGSAVHNSSKPTEKYDLEKELNLLTVLPKQSHPEAFKRIALMLDRKYSSQVKDGAKLDQVVHYLNEYGEKSPSELKPS